MGSRHSGKWNKLIVTDESLQLYIVIHTMSLKLYSAVALVHFAVKEHIRTTTKNLAKSTVVNCTV